MSADFRGSLRRSALALATLLLAGARAAGGQGMSGMPDAKGMMGWGRGSMFLFDQLEYAPAGRGKPVIVDGIGWVGGAYNRLWVRTEGEQPTQGTGGEGDAQLLYGRLVSPYWDLLAGVRVEHRWGGERETRAHLAVGLEGLAPYRFEAAPTVFLSQDGDLSARLEASYSILVTQRLVAEPEVELNAAVQEVPRFGVGKGLNDAEFGLRLRYELRRKYAPYVGVSHVRRFGGSADFARTEGATVRESRFVAGLRLWH